MLLTSLVQQNKENMASSKPMGDSTMSGSKLLLKDKPQKVESGGKKSTNLLHVGAGTKSTGVGNTTFLAPTHSSSSKSKVPSEKDLNKEVLKILQELNTNVNKQGKDLKALSERVDALYESEGDENYDYTAEVYTEDDYLCDSGQVSDHDTESDPLVSPSKKPKSLFQGLSDKYLLSDKVDSEINNDLASFVNTSFRNGVSADRILEISKDIHRPQNCEALVKTRVNAGMWRLLKPQTQTDDAKMQAIQNTVIKASINI